MEGKRADKIASGAGGGVEAFEDQFDILTRQRRSIRAFRATPVPENTLERLVAIARRAPSGANLQPGTFIEVRGQVRRDLCNDILAQWRRGERESEDYTYFPDPLPMALRKRQVASAQALYGALGVRRNDREGRDGQFEANFRFFDAPVALVVTMPEAFGPGGYMDLGMALYGLMLAAQSCGLASCAIGALASYAPTIRRHLELAVTTSIVCGVALGHADPQALVNHVRTARCDLKDYFCRKG